MDKSRKQAYGFMFAALLLGLITLVMITGYISNVQEQWGDTIEVLVAKTDITERTPLVAELVELKTIPSRYFHDSYLVDLNDLKDSPVALIGIPAGSILQRSMLDHNAGLKPGYRAVAIDVNRVQSVGGSLRIGNRVDVIATYEFAEMEQSTLKTELLLQDVEVIGISLYKDQAGAASMSMADSNDDLAEAVNPALAQPSYTVAEQRFSPTGELLSEATVTLALPIDEALTLVHFHNLSKDIRFAIRRLDEKDVPTLDGIDLLSQK